MAILSIIIIVLLLIWFGYTFNRLIRERNQVLEGWSGVEVQLKRRHELIPALIECVKGYRAHEAVLLERLTRARADAMQAPGTRSRGEAENGLSRYLGSVVVVAEAYPEIKASQQFRQLSANLVETEDNLQFARRFYNGAVRDYNNRVESFPSLLVARAFGFMRKEFFEIESAIERKNPEVQL